jgi:hypothetical protein
MSEHLTNKTFSILNNPTGFKQNPDLVDDFYRLSAKYEYFPQLVETCVFVKITSTMST